MRDFLLRHRALVLALFTAAALAFAAGLLAALSLLAVAFAIHEHHLRLRHRAAFRNCRRMLAAESRRNDDLEDYLDGVLAAARGDAAEDSTLMSPATLRSPSAATIMIGNGVDETFVFFPELDPGSRPLRSRGSF